MFVKISKKKQHKLKLKVNKFEFNYYLNIPYLAYSKSQTLICQNSIHINSNQEFTNQTEQLFKSSVLSEVYLDFPVENK